MARNADTIDYREDYYKGFAKIYFNRILGAIIEFGGLKNENGLILDYGCGAGHLKKYLKKDNIIGYDIIEELSEVDDYTKLRPSKIVLSGVLEHLRAHEISGLLADFYRMNPRAELLVYLPTENLISKIAMRLAGQKNAHDDHVTAYREVNHILEQKYRPLKRKYIFFRMAQITKYAPK